MFYQTTGKIIYKNNDWVVIDVHNSIANYYGWWVKKFTWKKGSTPLYGAHVTVLAGKHEKPAYYVNWRKHHEKIIPITYDSTVYTNGQYYWLKVFTPWVKTIRNELGLSDSPKWHPHITVYYID